MCASSSVGTTPPASRVYEDDDHRYCFFYFRIYLFTDCKEPTYKFLLQLYTLCTAVLVVRA